MKYIRFTVAMALTASAGMAWAGGVDVTTPQGRKVSVEAVTPDIIRVTNTAPGESVRPFLVPPSADNNVSVSRSGDISTFTTSTGVTVRVDAATGGVDINAGARRAVSDGGGRETEGGKRRMELSVMGGGSFYGAGERGYSFNLAGDTMVMYNKQNYGYMASEPRIKQMNISMPLFLSSDGYAVVFDDYAAAEMVMSDPIVYITESKAPVSYYFVNSAGSLASLTSTLTTLTGRQDLPPLWSLGYITSKYGYRTQAETAGVIDTLKRQGYPVDGVVLDLYWYGKEQDMGRLAWDPVQWPDHRKMLADLKKEGVNTVIISQPYVLRNGKALDNYNELTEKQLLLRDTLGGQQEVTIWVGEGGMFDVSNPDTRAWLRQRYRDLTLDGVGGWWGDLGEPEVHPESGLHANGQTTREYHNRYGNDWSKIIYDLYKEDFPDTRLMTMMRGGTTGLQQYSVFPWSTDVSRTWGGLKPQINIMLNSGLSGMGYMSHDVGGFAITDEENVTDPELYVRWMQLGAFSPVLRTHAQQFAEPFNYPEYQDILLDLVKTRYRWLPYNYTLAYENTTKGYPLVRPLNFRSAGIDGISNVTDQYLWGDEVMVAPVMEQGARSRKVIIPPGQWVDYNNPSVSYEGPDTIDYKAPLDVLPLFVRAGAFIPLADYGMENVGDFDASRYTVLYYPRSEESSGYEMFEDDRRSTSSLAKSQYAIVAFEAENGPDEIKLDVEVKGDYPGMPEKKTLTFVLPGIAPSTIAGLTVDGTDVPMAEEARSGLSSRNASFVIEVAKGQTVKVVIKKARK